MNVYSIEQARHHLMICIPYTMLQFQPNSHAAFDFLGKGGGTVMG
jgi:hypothetical protein